MADDNIQPNFAQYLNGLAIQTMVHLGKIANPMNGETRVDLPNAKFSIEILGLLREKTKGNLTAEEERFLSAVLADLRLQYVEAVKTA